MAKAKDDDSTDIEALVKKFVADINSECKAMQSDQIKAAKKDAEKNAKDKKDTDGPKDPPLISFKMDPNPATKSRTPAEQAAQVVAKRSQVCWSAHMADRARHVFMYVDGKGTLDYKKVLGDNFETFKKTWKDVMNRNGLCNADGKVGWCDWDEMHLEVPDSKISREDERTKACFEEYARLSRKDKKGTNAGFEKEYSKDLKPYLEKYESTDEKKK